VSEPADARVSSCEQCGYPLAGILPRDQAGMGACPECGAAFDAHNHWRRKPWPSLPQLALRLCGPAFAIAAAFIACGFVRVVRTTLIWPVLTIWLVVLFMLCVAWPMAEIGSLANECEPIVSRHCRRRRLRLVVLITNTLVFATAALIFATFLK